MDYFVLAGGIGTFIVYFLFHIVVFRMVEDRLVFKSLIFVFVFVGILQGVVISSVLNLFLGESFLSILTVVATSFFIYFNLSFFFVLAIFGVSISSIRIQILDLISQSKLKGVSTKVILMKYNRDIILRTRLNRLISSGEIKRSGDYFVAHKRFSYFIIHTYVLVLMYKLYGGNKYTFNNL